MSHGESVSGRRDAGSRDRRRRLGFAGAIGFVACISAWAMLRETPNARLLRALADRDYAMAESVLRQGANPNLRVEWCWPSRQWSDRLSNLYWKARDPREYSDVPLLFAVTARRDSRAVGILLAHGADAGWRTPDGLSARTLASNGGAAEIVREFDAVRAP